MDAGTSSGETTPRSPERWQAPRGERPTAAAPREGGRSRATHLDTVIEPRQALLLAENSQHLVEARAHGAARERDPSRLSNVLDRQISGGKPASDRRLERRFVPACKR